MKKGVDFSNKVMSMLGKLLCLLIGLYLEMFQNVIEDQQKGIVGVRSINNKLVQLIIYRLRRSSD